MVVLGDTREWLESVRHDLREALAEADDAYLADYSDQKRRNVKREIVETIDLLDQLARRIDPVRQPGAVFNPSNPTTIGRMIALCMANRAPRLVSNLDGDPFYGGGVYAIYYRGNHPAYAPIANRPIPIYVGKADPSEVQADSPEEQGTKLWHRLCKDHLKNLRLAENLEEADFDCRYLVTLSGYQSAAEAFLIETFKPIWNNEVKICFGFGKHGDSASTRSNTRSPWDTLHPGRAWAWAEGNTPNERTEETIIADILRHYEANDPEEMEARMSDLSDILR
jgi:hypothetical protein